MAAENPIDAAVGAFVLRIRRDFGITQPAITELANDKYAAGWSASSVNNIETGRASMTLPVLTILIRVLSELTKVQISIMDMIAGAESALVAPDGSAATQKHLRRILVGVRNGNEYSRTSTDAVIEARAARALGLTRAQMQRTAEEIFEGNTLVTEIEARCTAAGRSPQRPFDFNSAFRICLAELDTAISKQHRAQ